MKNILSNSHKGDIVTVAGKYSVIECQKCTFKHIYPIPTQEDVIKLYSKTFYTSEKKNYIKDAKEDLEWWRKTYQNYYSILEKYSAGRKILDIGSGPGYFLKVGKELGWNVLGIEPSKQAHAYSTGLGINVINDFFSAKVVNQFGPFDVVSLNLVLEHIPNPIVFLEQIKSILSPNGLLFILSPNDYNPLQEILYQHLHYKSWWVVPDHHINYFNIHSIKKVLHSLHFIIVDTLATYPMEFFLLQGNNYIGNRTIGRKCHRLRKEFELHMLQYNPNLLNSLYRDIIQSNIGREFVVIGRINNT